LLERTGNQRSKRTYYNPGILEELGWWAVICCTPKIFHIISGYLVLQCFIYPDILYYFRFNACKMSLPETLVFDLDSQLKMHIKGVDWCGLNPNQQVGSKNRILMPSGWFSRSKPLWFDGLIFGTALPQDKPLGAAMLCPWRSLDFRTAIRESPWVLSHLEGDHEQHLSCWRAICRVTLRFDFGTSNMAFSYICLHVAT
jgi:hypothetical protein